METILNLDKEFFLFLNSLHADWLDSFFVAVSNKYVWIPLYCFVFYKLYHSFTINEFYKVVTLLLLSVALSDITASGIIKPLTKRNRPTHNTEIASQVHTVNNYKGGTYGFVSSHAANACTIATWIILLFNKNKRFVLGISIYVLLVCYSRIYLGVHYPLDIIGGAIIGAFWAALLHYIYQHKLKKN